MTLVPPTGPKFRLADKATRRLFLRGAAWAAMNSLPPVAITMWGYWRKGERVDWTIVGPLLAATIGTALVGYWQTYKSMLKQPK
jgi:hypothetical protein